MYESIGISPSTVVVATRATAQQSKATQKKMANEKFKKKISTSQQTVAAELSSDESLQTTLLRYMKKDRKYMKESRGYKGHQNAFVGPHSENSNVMYKSDEYKRHVFAVWQQKLAGIVFWNLMKFSYQ